MIQIDKATPNDIDLLIRLRVDFILDEAKTLEDIEGLRENLRGYYSMHIPDGSLVAYIARESGEVCSTAFLGIHGIPPRSADMPCWMGTIYNVYTYPEFRRKGYATQVLRALLEQTESLGLATVDLLATDEGKPLYEKLGFQPGGRHTYMRMKLS